MNFEFPFHTLFDTNIADTMKCRFDESGLKGKLATRLAAKDQKKPKKSKIADKDKKVNNSAQFSEYEYVPNISNTMDT